MRTKLTQVLISDKKKDGTPFIDRNGKPYKRIGIKIDNSQYVDKWLSNFIWSSNDPMNYWKVGQEVEIVVEKKGDFLNFKVPSQLDLIRQRLLILENDVRALKDFMLASSSKPAAANKEIPDGFEPEEAEPADYPEEMPPKVGDENHDW